MSKVTTDATFSNDVLTPDVPVLVDFWAPWCGPCKMIGPTIESVGEKTAGKAKVYKLNVDENPETASNFGITGIPTVLIFKNGKVEKTLVGAQKEQTYLKALGI